MNDGFAFNDVPRDVGDCKSWSFASKEPSLGKSCRGVLEDRRQFISLFNAFYDFDVSVWDYEIVGAAVSRAVSRDASVAWLRLTMTDAGYWGLCRSEVRYSHVIELQLRPDWPLVNRPVVACLVDGVSSRQ